MKTRFYTSVALLTFVWLAATSHAGISVSNPGTQNNYFTIWFGLGSPEPGKVAYVSVTKPNGYNYTVDQAENIPDYSRACYVSADQAGWYRFFYEYSFYSQGVGRTVVFYQDHYVSPPVSNINWGTAYGPPVGAPNTTVQITANFYNPGPTAYGGDHYIEFQDHWGTQLFYVPLNYTPSNGIGTRYGGVTLPYLGVAASLQYRLRAIHGNVGYFGSTKLVDPIADDYPPTTSLSAPTSAVLDQPITVTSSANDVYSNLTAHAIDYKPPGGNWVYGSTGAGTRWDGGPQGSSMLSLGLQLNTPGDWEFHSRSSDPYQLSEPQSRTVNVALPIPSCTVAADATTITSGGTVTITVNATNARYINVDQTTPNNGWYGNVSSDDEFPPSGGFYDLGSIQSNPSRALPLTLHTFSSNPNAPVTYTFRGAVNAGGNWYYSGGTVSVTVNPQSSLPVFGTNPQGTSVVAGANVSFTASATGIPTPTYQWQRYANGSWNNLGNGGSYSGVTTTTLTVFATTTAMHGDQFRCVASNSAGSVGSGAATLLVTSAPSSPVFSTQPVATTVTAGATATFTAIATGSPAPTYQWQHSVGGVWQDLSNGGAYSGVTSTTLTVSGTTANMTGDQFRCKASNSSGSATSIVAVLTISSGSGDITTGLVGWWKLDDNGSTAVDSSGNNNHGVLVNGASWTGGNVGPGSVSLDGINDYVLVNHSSSLNLNTFSVGGWIYVTGSNYWRPIFTKENDNGVERNYGLYVGVGANPRYHYSYMFNGCSTFASFDSNAVVAFNTWQHVMMVYDGSTFTLYINGVADSSQNVAGMVPCQSVTPFRIGEPPSPYESFSGKIDDVRVYNRALTPADVTAVYSLAGTGDTVDPTVAISAPTYGATVVGSSVIISADASDNVAVAGVRFQVDGVDIGVEATASPYTISWDSTTVTNGAHTLTAIARDAANNISSATNQITVSNQPGGGNGLVGWWKFDEGTGGSVADSSGSGHTGTLFGSHTWSAPRVGNYSISLDGASDYGNMGEIALGSTFSVSAWTRFDPSTGHAWNRIAETGFQTGFYLGLNGDRTRYLWIVNNPAVSGSAEGGVVDGNWNFVVGTYDGSVGRLYVNGTLVASANFMNPGSTTKTVFVGKNGVWEENTKWKGQLDDIRVYDRVLTQSDVFALYTNPGPNDTIDPTINITGPVAGAIVVGSLVTIAADASDNVGVVDVQFALDGSSLGPPDSTNPYMIVWDSTTASNGAHTLTATARDAAGNMTTSAPIVVTVSNSSGPDITAGLVGWWKLDDNGSTAVDSSGNNNHGVLVNGASWAGGNVGPGSVSLDGINDYVLVNHSSSLNLNTFSVGGWIYVTGSNYWRPIFTKENDNGVERNYGLYVGVGANPRYHYSYMFNGCSTFASFDSNAAVAFNTWQHVMMVYDGSTFTLYINGVADSSQNVAGMVPCQSVTPFRIGEPPSPYESFSGKIDDVRVYNRALSSADVSAVYTNSPPTGGALPPTNFRQTEIGSNHVALAWNAPTGGGAVDFYEISNGPGPLVFAEANQTSFLWSGLNPLTSYTFQVRSVDMAGNRSAWATLSSVFTLAAGSPSGTSKWIDLARTDYAGGSNYVTSPPDGIRDEVIGVDQSRFAASIVQSSWSYSFNNFWTLWGITWPDGTFTPNFTFALMMEPFWDYDAPPITHVDVDLSFNSEPGQVYAILVDDSEGHAFHPENAVQHSLPTSFPNSAQQHIYASIGLEQLQFAKFYLVRYAFPIGGISIPGTSTSVSVGTTRGAGGTLGLPLPLTGNVVISIKDAVGTLLKAGSDVAWQVWDGINQIRVGNSALGDLLDLGINTSGQFQVGLKLNDSTTVWVNVDVQPPAPAMRSRDRYLTGSIDTSSSFYRVNNLEFINATTGENLGMFRLDGSSGTYIYDSEDDILSDAENDAVWDDSLAGGSLQLSQQVVFWRESPGSSTIRFSTVFNAVGAIEIRVKQSDGALLHTVHHTLTAEPHFGGLLTHLDARILSLAMPAVAPWSLLPAIEGIDDDDVIPASNTPARAAAAHPVILSSQPAVAATGWQTNFLIKVATTADTALNSPEYSNRLQFGTGEIRGYVDGIWDGFASDITGIAELAKMGWESVVKGDHTRAKALRDGIKDLYVTVTNKASRDQLCEIMFEKFVAKTQAAVPWAFSEDSALWGLDAYAYMYGYIRGFITEQVGVAMLGAGIVTKAGVVIKSATSGAKLAQLTGAMITNTQRFTVAAYLSASRHAAKYGNGAMRAVRKAIAEVGKQSIDGVTTVGEQMAYLVERLGTEGVTWHKIADNAFALCVNEAEVLRVGISLYPQLAKLQVRLGNLLSRSATEGFLNVWGRRGQQGMLGECVHYLYEGFEGAAPLTAQELARFLEIVDGSILTFTSSGAWRLHPFARGFLFEPVIARLLNTTLLAPAFKTIDIWIEAQGLVVSIKSLDATAQTYQSITELTRVVNKYVDLVSSYPGQLISYGGVTIFPNQIVRREVQLVIRPGASGAQQAALNSAVQRAAGLPTPVDLVIREIP